MEVYFSGTIERIIFENVSNFFRILLLDIEDTNAEDFDDYEIIVTGTMADIIEGEEYTFWGQIVQHSKYGEQREPSRLVRAWSSISPAAILRELDSKQPRKLWIFTVKTLLTKS